MTTDRATKIYDFIVTNANAGLTVYLQTYLKTTAVRKKHLAQIRVRDGALEIQHGRQWIDYTWVSKVTAA